MFLTADGKALPQRPPERSSKDSERLSIVTDDDEGNVITKTVNAAILGQEQPTRAKPPHVGMLAHIPPRRQSLQTSPYASPQRLDRHSQGVKLNGYEEPMMNPAHIEAPHREYMPPPLSPRAPLLPAPTSVAETNINTQSSADVSSRSILSEDSDESESFRQGKEEHTSWLNTINESSGSSSSSVHSRRSSIGLRRKRIRAASGQTEADFDAALDAAVEAAYDDGFEPDDEDEEDEQLLDAPEYRLGESEPLSQVRRNIELAKENVREAEREGVIARAKERERQLLKGKSPIRDSIDGPQGDEEDEEEERMLEEMTRDYIMDDSEYNVQTKSALPRQSDSSSFSGRTWDSSIGSDPTSAGTTLSTVTENYVLPSLATQLKESLPPPLHPPPSTALPEPPLPTTATLTQSQTGVPRQPPSLITRNTSPGVRDRRLSAAKRKPLKIETNTKVAQSIASEAPKTQPPHGISQIMPVQVIPEPPKSAFSLTDPPQAVQGLVVQRSGSSADISASRKGSLPLAGSDPPDVLSSTTSALGKIISADSDHSVPSMPNSPARLGTRTATGLRKNFSSSSLRNKSLTVSVPDNIDASSTASLSSLSSTPKQRRVPSPAIPVLPTPIETNFITKGQAIGGIYLFDNDIHSLSIPGSPNPLANSAPLPLEPCPESTLLRPFWILRCIYQTLAHPRGGYISNKLFVPRDIWRVKNIKLRSVEEKVSNCDLLTAALLKLGKVDTLDADAVLEEMQFFEAVMEQVQANLTKKLGSEVGVHGAAQAIKNVGSVEEAGKIPDPLSAKTTNGSTKSYLSWRKLRSKNSTGSALTPVSSTNSPKDGSQDVTTMKSLPMTSMQNPRFPKRDVNQVQCFGPNPSYMGALARLCDAAQVLGQANLSIFNFHLANKLSQIKSHARLKIQA